MKKTLKIKHQFENSNKFSDLEILNILGQYMKNYVYIFVYASLAQLYIHNSEELRICSQYGTIFVTIVQIGAGFMGLLNLGTFIRHKHLKIGNFLVLYLINMIFFLFLISFVIYQILYHQKECNTLVVLQKALLYVCFKKEFEVTVLLFTRSQWWMRQINICTNCAFSVIVLTSLEQEVCNPQAIINNNLVNIINIATFVSYTIMNYLIRNQDQSIQIHVLKISSIMVVSSFIYAYAKVLITQFTGVAHFSPECIPIIYALDAYVYVIPIDLLGMIFVHVAISKEYKKYNLINQNDSDSLLNLNDQCQEGIQQIENLQYIDKDEEFQNIEMVKS